MALQGLNYIAPLLVWPYLMKTLGAIEFGKIGFATSINLFLMVIVDYGFNLTATKKIALAAENQDEVNAIFSRTILAKALLLSVALCIMAILLVLPQYAVYRTTSLIMMCILLNSLLSPIWLFQGLGKIRIASIINCTSKLVIFPLFFVLVRSANDTLVAATLQASMYVLSGTILFGLALGKHYANFTKTTWSNVKNELHDGFPIFVSQAATSIYTALFVVILGYFVQADEVGKYAAAEKIMRAGCYLIWIPIAQAFFPKISQLSVEKRAEAQKLIHRIALFLIFAMSAVGIVILFFAEPVAAWLGRDYSGMGELTKILAFAPLLISLGGVTGQFGLLALGNEREKRHYSVTYIIAAAIAFVAIFALVPFFGAKGASVAVLIVEAWVFLSMSVCYKRSTKKLRIS